jgi:hypothetical protein
MTTNMPVVNKYTHIKTSEDVYIGRGSFWGNPFVIGKDGDRDDVVRKYAEMICDNQEMLSRLHELRGKNLVCYCAPKLCHGHVLEDLSK